MRLQSLTVLLLLVMSLSSCKREDFGVSPTSLLGDATRIEALLLEKGLEKSSASCDLRALAGRIPNDDSAPVPGRCDSFIDDARANDTQSAKLYYSADNRLVAVRVDFRSDARGFDKGYYKVGRFIYEYWMVLGGREREFRQAGGGVQILGKEALEAVIDDELGFHGHWTKQIFEGNLQDRVQDEVLIRLL